MEIGLRSTAALAQAACEASGRLGTLQINFLRVMANGYTTGAKQWMTSEPSGDADATLEAMEEGMGCWRSFAGLVASAQVEMAEIADSGLQELLELTETNSANHHKGGHVGPADLPMTISAATTLSLLTTAQVLCRHLGHSAQQFSANGGTYVDFDRGLPTGQAHAGNGRVRNHRKAA